MTHFTQTTQADAATNATVAKPRLRLPLRLWRALLWLAGVTAVALATYFVLIWPWISRWGATDAEVAQALPGDELVPQASLVTTKAVTVAAPPEAIWPWLVQLGVDRGGMYSYLWVENWLMRLGVENATEIRPEWQTLTVGDFIRFTPRDYPLNPGPGLYVLAVEPNHALLGCFGMENSPPGCSHGATWQFVLEPQADGMTRLLLRSRMADAGSALARSGAKLTSAFSFYMERKMLLTLQARAEMLAGLE